MVGTIKWDAVERKRTELRGESREVRKMGYDVVDVYVRKLFGF
jgi:hypothetical protein